MHFFTIFEQGIREFLLANAKSQAVTDPPSLLAILGVFISAFKSPIFFIKTFTYGPRVLLGVDGSKECNEPAISNWVIFLTIKKGGIRNFAQIGCF